MMPSILALPNEILAKIFSDQVLSDADISRAIQVCKAFKGNIQECAGRRLTFVVDAASHPGWKFARCLLRTPDIGEHFVGITVEWDRRNWMLWKDQKIKKVWTADWVWTEPEREQISTICNEWDITEQTISLILGGRNSEALLPLILCFTTKLKSLDLGNIEPHLMSFGNISFAENMYGSALELLGHSSDYDEEDNDSDDSDGGYRSDGPKKKYWRIVNTYRSQNHSLFFFENLQYKLDGNIVGPKTLFPGLASLEFFSIGKADSASENLGVKIRDSEYFPILLLPRIKDVQFFTAVASRYSYLDHISAGFPSPDTFEPHSDEASTVRRLRLACCLIERGYDDYSAVYRDCIVEKISKLTSNLEWAYIQTKSAYYEENTKDIDEPLGRLFLQNAPSTLKPSDILINGGGFNEAGTYLADEERRREVTRKQKTFDLFRKRLQTMKPPPIVTLSNQLISKLLAYLRRQDVFNLMLSCKAFYDTCYRDMWSSFRLGPYDIGDKFRNFLGPTTSVRLARSTETLGIGGFEHLERLEFAKHFYRDDDYEASGLKILETLANQIELGNTPKLRFLSVSWTRNLVFTSFGRPSGWDHSSNHRFLQAIKEHSKKRSSDDFSLNLLFQMDSLPKINPESQLDLSKLRNLKLSMGWDVNAEQTIQNVNYLINVFTASPYLETLTIKQETRRKGIEGETEQLWESLAVLQEVFGNLQHLKSLSSNGAFLIHPSFLLVPPPSCKSVSYDGRMTISWWRKFAREPFAAVERMSLKCGNLTEEEQKALKEGSEEEWTPTDDINLGNVEISGLRWLDIHSPSGGLGKDISLEGYPADFLACMLKKNTQLSEECLRPMAKQVAEEYTKARRRIISDVVAEFGNQLKKDLSAALDTYATESALKNILDKRSVGEDFQSEMRNKPIDMLLQKFEGEFGPQFVTQCTDDLRTKLRDGAPSRPHSPPLGRYNPYGSHDRGPGSDTEWEAEVTKKTRSL
ncbi:hypothetical protein TWF281_010376 [Arthrobotrys megalospora]